MAQGAAANIPDQPLMPAQEDRKRLVVVLAGVEVQKLAVAQVPGLFGIDQVTNVLQDCIGSVCGHIGLSEACQGLPLYSSLRRANATAFCQIRWLGATGAPTHRMGF